MRLADAWTWDFWLADDGDHYHLFVLKASRALLDPDRRHWNATVGHAVSSDLKQWHEVADALAISPAPRFDDLATWTGSVVPDGKQWRMFYTGSSRIENGLKQRIGSATSTDLLTWTKQDEPVLECDERWYEALAPSKWRDEAWRDPWVFADPDGNGWHMLITARAGTGPDDDRGVIGYASSPDLVDWTIGPPRSEPGSGFGHLEVPQVEVVDGQPVLLFSCLGEQLASRRHGDGGGVWCIVTEDIRGPFRIDRAARITDETLYSGRLVRNRSGDWMLLAFRNMIPGPSGDIEFAGELSDPLPVSWNADRTALVVTRG